MIIPISHESNEVRRLPWVSFIIILMCLVIHFFVSKSMDRINSDVKRDLKHYFVYFMNHPYLNINEKIKSMLNIDETVLDKVKSIYEGRAEIPDQDTVLDEQKELNRIGSLMLKSVGTIPFYKWGYIPARGGIPTLISYMFIHGGWLHLLGNLLVLYLTGPYLEDIWGRIVYPVFFISAGMFSALMYSLRFPDLKIPLIGASGAIAGLMGAFLVRFWKTRVKFFYFFFVIAGTFRAPAWIMLPLWFGFEAFDASRLSSMNSGGGGVAHHVHVWGFIFGVVIALIFKFTRLEERYFTKTIEEKISFVDKGFETYSSAKALYEEDKKEKAYSILINYLKEHPVSQESVELLWIIGYDLGRRGETVEFMIRLIESEVMSGKEELALSHFGQLKLEYPEAKINISHEIALLGVLVKKENLKWAEELACDISGKINMDSPPGIIIQFIEKVSKTPLFGLEPIRKAAAFTLDHPEISEVKKKEIRELLGKFGDPKSESPEGEEGQGPEFKFYKAVLKGISKDKLLFVFGNKESKTVPITAIKEISVSRILRDPDEPEIMVDLFLDPVKKTTRVIRSIRLAGSSLDPLRFAPKAQNRSHAMKIVLTYIQKSSNARPLPDIEYIELKRHQDFRSEKEYENFLRIYLKI